MLEAALDRSERRWRRDWRDHLRHGRRSVHERSSKAALPIFQPRLDGGGLQHGDFFSADGSPARELVLDVFRMDGCKRLC